MHMVTPDTPGPSAAVAVPEAASKAPGPTAPSSVSSPAGFSTRLHHSQDADDHAANLTDWHQHYDQLSSGPFSGTLEEFWFGKTQIFREDLNQSIHQTGQPWPDSHTFGLPTRIEGTGWFSGKDFLPHSILTLGKNSELDFRTPQQLEIVACTVDAEALGLYALQVDHPLLEDRLQYGRLVHTSPQQLKALRTLFATVLGNLREHPELLRHPQMRKVLEQALFASILDVVSPHAAMTDMPPQPAARQRLVARAREYVLAHIEDPITVADLCVAFKVSRRTLQYSFQDVLGLNPVRFLRAMRLNAVRRALKQASPGNTTVGDVAARWGFWHLSHFAADYRAMFGELPSETLRRPQA